MARAKTCRIAVRAGVGFAKFRKVEWEGEPRIDHWCAAEAKKAAFEGGLSRGGIAPPKLFAAHLLSEVVSANVLHLSYEAMHGCDEEHTQARIMLFMMRLVVRCRKFVDVLVQRTNAKSSRGSSREPGLLLRRPGTP
jgi:hypothetical protein